MKFRILVIALWTISGFFLLATSLTIAGMGSGQGSIGLLIFDLTLAVFFAIAGIVVDRRLVRKR